MVRDGRLLVAGPLSDLVGSRTRQVDVRFAEEVDPSRYAGPGVGPPQVDGRRHRFSLSGDPAPLLEALGALPVEEVTIERASLEDAFRELYSDGTAT